MQNPYSLHIVENLEHYRQYVAAQPQQGLVDLAAAIPCLRLDIKYAGTDNFTGKRLYPEARAFLRQPAAEALRAAQSALAEKGLGICVFDAYRPYSVSLQLWEYMRDERYVAAPWTGSRHNRGCAVDITLIDATDGSLLPMPTAYDDFSARAHHHFTDLPDNVLRNRNLLLTVMHEHGFSPLATEWWHYDFIGWENYALLDLPFAALQEDAAQLL